MLRFLPTFSIALLFGPLAGGCSITVLPERADTPDAIEAVAGPASAPLQLHTVFPTELRGGTSELASATASGFDLDAVLLLDGATLPTQLLSGGRLSARVPPHRKGYALLHLRSGGRVTPGLPVSFGNTAPELAAPGDQLIDENATWALKLSASDFDGDPVRLFPGPLPPGAEWSEALRSFSFRPDFIQGGQAWPIEVVASDGVAQTVVTFTLRVKDNISPPVPTVVAAARIPGCCERLTVSQRTDAFLDSPGNAGRTFTGNLAIIPEGATATNRKPINISLHGYGGAPSPSTQSASEFTILPVDTEETYWWGYSERLPGGTAVTGAVPDYTARRVLALLGWVLKNYPGADPERVRITGGSMGGTGAVTIGLLHARHFAHVSAGLGQLIPRNHRPLRLATLSALWGTPAAGLTDGEGMNVWDRQDLTRVLRDSNEARSQYVSLRHAKDDATIHFGAVVFPSPLTLKTFYEALADERVGHYLIWDEGAHGRGDPGLGSAWWDNGWNRTYDPSSFLRRNLAFPAFHSSSANDHPGTGKGNGRRAFHPESGYAGVASVKLDTGWDGDVAGVINRWLRWDAAKLIDAHDRLELPLRVQSGAGTDAPAPGYPVKGDKLLKPLPIKVDVTLRRVQRFRCLPNEPIGWRFGAAKGVVLANPDGSVTVRNLDVQPAWTTLALERTAAPRR